MELASLHSLAQTEEGQTLWLTYKLLCREDRYGILCYLEGMDPARHPHASAAIEDLFPSRDRAEALLLTLASHTVTPQHLADIVWEL